MNVNNRNHLIDLLRFLSALLVAFFHFNQPITYIDNWYRNFLKMGYLGVPVFFVISGYCVAQSAYHSKNWQDFTIRRVFRIFPPYYFSLVVVLMIVLALKIITGYNSVVKLPKTISQALLALTLLTKPFTKFEGINWVYWSLTCEIFFYALMAILLRIASKFHLLYFILISLLAVIIPAETIGPLFFLKYWPIFALGVGLYFIHAHKYLKLSYTLLLINGGAMVKLFWLTGQIPYCIATLAAIVLIWLSFSYKLPKNIFSVFGDYSYSVYLLHVPLGVYLMGNYKTLAIQQNIYLNIGYDVLSYLITFGAAYLTFKYVELPSIKWGKSFSQNLNLKPRGVTDKA